MASVFGASALALGVVVAPCLASADAPRALVGTITDFHGKYGLVVRDERGRVLDVQLRQGTIIKPVGLRLERGMHVTVLGQDTAGAFAAGEIDTAYQLPPQRAPKAAPGTDAPKPARPVADGGRFNDIPGDIGASRLPDTGPAVGGRPPR